MSQFEDTFTFNEENSGDLAGNNAAQANAADSVAARQGANSSLNASRSSAVGTTSGSGNMILGTGATYVESLDAGTISGAFDFGAKALTGSNDLASKFLAAFDKSQTQNAALQNNLLAGFQGITEATNSTLRGALASTLDAPALAKPADTSATLSASSTQRLVIIGAALLGLYFLPRRR